MQHTQTVQFAVVEKNGVVEQIGKGILQQPKTKFKANGGITWYEDKPREKGNVDIKGDKGQA